MKLTPDERDALKQSKPIKCWRFYKPTASDIGRRYTSEDTVYTVMDVKELKPSDVMRTQSRGVWEALKLAWPPDVATAWMIVLIQGDYTDRLRLMQPSGRRSGDYTETPARAMRGEPEAISAIENEEYAKEARAMRDEKLRTYGGLSLEAVEAQLRTPGLRREERKKLRYARHAIKKLGGQQ